MTTLLEPIGASIIVALINKFLINNSSLWDSCSNSRSQNQDEHDDDVSSKNSSVVDTVEVHAHCWFFCCNILIVELCCLTFFVGGFAMYIGFVTSKVKPHYDDRLFKRSWGEENIWINTPMFLWSILSITIVY